MLKLVYLSIVIVLANIGFLSSIGVRFGHQIAVDLHYEKNIIITFLIIIIVSAAVLYYTRYGLF